ncbi:hypothetical protein [Streptomyces luteoverticillatus]|uniref:hypothetical protein n=1 Tax=Streptomyces luteoverticillatus TaxID=66425 RepID=UPI001F0BA5B8|nr:hypothetical protein [Streptomyces luteoverticillatus]
MSWPQNPQQPQQPEQPQNPSTPPQGGFGPPPTWGPDGDGHAQPTMISQPAVPPPPGPARGGAPGAVPPPPPPAPGPVPGAPGPVPGAQGPGMAPPPGMPPAPMGQQPMAPQPMGQQPMGQQPWPPQPHAPQGQPAGQGPQAGKSNKTLMAVIGGVVALAVIGGGAYAFLGGSGGDDDKKNDKPQAGQAQSQAPAAPGQQSDKPADAGASADPSAQQPTVPGWQTQTRADHYFQYDVPGKTDKWKVFPTDTAISYTEDGKPVVVMTGTSNYKEGGCSSQPNPDAVGEAGQGQLATVGTTGGGKDGDLKTNAKNWAGNWGFMAYGGKDHKPKLEFTDEKEWKHNGIDGWTATAKVTVTNRPSPCVPPTAIVKSIAQKMPDGTFHGWVIYADQGVPDALTEAQIDKIMNTVRPAKGPGA